MKFSSKRKNGHIPTSSMADIAFLLIIFFMVTTVFSATKGLDFRLPEEKEDMPPTPVESVYIQVQPGGRIVVDGRTMTLSQILPYLKPKLERWPDKPVILHTDPQATFQDMVTVFDELKRGEEVGIPVKNIAVPTSREIGEYVNFFGFNPFENRIN